MNNPNQPTRDEFERLEEEQRQLKVEFPVGKTQKPVLKEYQKEMHTLTAILK